MADIEPEHTPIYPVKKRLSGQYEGTFAHTTVKDRMVKVVTQVVDTMNKNVDKALEDHGQDGVTDLQSVIAKLSELRYLMQTDKPLPLLLSGNNLQLWQEVREVYLAKYGKEPTWFSASWLYVECFMYRKITDIFQSSTFFKTFDPFEAQKTASFFSYQDQAAHLAQYLKAVVANEPQELAVESLRLKLCHFLLISLWGNKTDLSMIATADTYNASQDMTSVEGDTTEEIAKLLTNVLSDHSQNVWDILNSATAAQVDIVLDNAGFELFTDLCFAEVLIHFGLSKKVVFHCKQLPWFVSDASVADFKWLLDQLCCHANQDLAKFGKRWKQRVTEGTWELVDHSFWTLPHEYAKMSSIAPDLYKELSKSTLIFFKGDLNYRKLAADRNWPYRTPFTDLLEGFSPSSVCAMRTLKADLVGGLPPGKAGYAATCDKNWLVSGQFGVIQVHQHA